MHRQLHCGGFQQPYDRLCHRKRIDASWLEIAKHLMLLEAEHTPLIGVDRVFCLNEGLISAVSMFSLTLRPRMAFLKSPATRLSAKSARAGEALTRWFAQRCLKAGTVLNLEVDHAVTLDFRESVTAKSKPGGPVPRKSASAKRRPDFAAFAGATPHILESKGTSGKHVYAGNLERSLADALVQVSTVKSVNGLTPATRTGCSFGFDSRGVRGTVWDPPESVESFDVKADLAKLVRSYYSGFLGEARPAPLGNGFVGYELAAGVRISVDLNIFERVLKLEGNESATAFLVYLQERRGDLVSRDYRSDRHTGSDGVRLEADLELLKAHQRWTET